MGISYRNVWKLFKASENIELYSEGGVFELGLEFCGRLRG